MCNFPDQGSSTEVLAKRGEEKGERLRIGGKKAQKMYHLHFAVSLKILKAEYVSDELYPRVVTTFILG